MRRGLCLALALLLLVLCNHTAESQETLHCASLRAEGAAYIEQQQVDQDNVRTYTLAQLPWHVLPDGDTLRIALPGEPAGRMASLQEVLLSAPQQVVDQIHGLLSQQEELLSFDLLKLELGAKSSTGAVRCDDVKGDLLSLHWYESTFSKSFSDYPMTCNYLYPQEFGVATGSGAVWGDTPRAVRDGTVFQPRGGREAMSMAVVRINKYKQRFIPLSLSTHSGSTYPLAAVTLRSCVRMANLTLLKSQVEHVLQVANMTDILSPDSLQAASAAALTTRISSVEETAITDPLLWPISECIEEDTNGSCVAHFGYVLLGTQTAIDVPLAPGQNEFDPPDVGARVKGLPTHFEPGIHRNVFKVRYFCHGKRINEWVDAGWTLQGTRAGTPKGAEKCVPVSVQQARNAHVRRNEVHSKLVRHLLNVEETPVEDDTDEDVCTSLVLSGTRQQPSAPLVGDASLYKLEELRAHVQWPEACQEGTPVSLQVQLFLHHRDKVNEIWSVKKAATCSRDDSVYEFTPTGKDLPYLIQGDRLSWRVSVSGSRSASGIQVAGSALLCSEVSDNPDGPVRAVGAPGRRAVVRQSGNVTVADNSTVNSTNYNGNTATATSASSIAVSSSTTQASTASTTSSTSSTLSSTSASSSTAAASTTGASASSSTGAISSSTSSTYAATTSGSSTTALASSTSSTTTGAASTSLASSSTSALASSTSSTSATTSGSSSTALASSTSSTTGAASTTQASSSTSALASSTSSTSATTSGSSSTALASSTSSTTGAASTTQASSSTSALASSTSSTYASATSGSSTTDALASSTSYASTTTGGSSTSLASSTTGALASSTSSTSASLAATTSSSTTAAATSTTGAAPTPAPTPTPTDGSIASSVHWLGEIIAYQTDCHCFLLVASDPILFAYATL